MQAITKSHAKFLIVKWSPEIQGERVDENIEKRWDMTFFGLDNKVASDVSTSH